MISIDFEEFFLWLASHTTNEQVGQPGRCFHSPLARFLSWKSGYVIGEDGKRYGRSVMDDYRWLPLPFWAQSFATFSERSFGHALSAYDALDVLVQVETLLASALIA